MTAAQGLLARATPGGVRRELARRSLIDFTLYTKPSYLAGAFHHDLAARLDRFLEACVAGRSPRLMVLAPPRHGKTELTSRRLPAFALGRHPDMNIIATSYAAPLASSINRDVQRIMDEESYAELFPGTRLNGRNVRTVADGSYLRNSDIFEVVGREGLYVSAGVNGGITGRGAHLGIIDDPVKDAAEAHSPTVRDSVHEWYSSTFYTRLAPGGGILLIMTRWHHDDLAGRLLDLMRRGEGEEWEVACYPALAEKGDALGRAEGEALHPERYPVEALEKIRRGTQGVPGVGGRVWTSLYQQRPTPDEGGIFKRENWKYWKPVRELGLMSLQDRRDYLRGLGVTQVVQRWDTALGAKKKNDLTACATLAIAPSRYYLLDVWQERVEYPDAKRQIQLLYDKWRPNRVNVEGGGSASGKAAVQELKRTTTIPIFEVTTSSDKVLRAQLVGPNQESGLVYLPEGEPWVADFVEKCANFPDVPNDDDVDAFVGALEHATSGPAPIQISDSFLRRTAR